MVAGWREAGLYRQIRGRAHPKGKWVLHDGPPYANGDIHMGHLINKVLKDIVVKFRTMQGYDSPFVPGWDCHGLPIETAVQKELGSKFRELGKEELRKKCAEYAIKFVKQQGDSFQRLGVFGEFERPYLTLDPKYEGGILDVLAELVKGDLVYRQKKPVHWCVNDRTALAEAELEYATKKDTSVYVEFSIANFETSLNTPAPWREFLLREVTLDQPTTLSLMIWTTTPWTLPANRAVAVHPEYEYSIVRFPINREMMGKKIYDAVVIATKLVEKVMATAGIADYKVSEGITGGDWVATNPKYSHPLEPFEKQQLQPVVLADYVTLEDGTGLVHTAPGHGKEDYQTGLKYGLEVYNPVLADGPLRRHRPRIPQRQIHLGRQPTRHRQTQRNRRPLPPPTIRTRLPPLLALQKTHHPTRHRTMVRQSLRRRTLPRPTHRRPRLPHRSLRPPLRRDPRKIDALAQRRQILLSGAVCPRVGPKPLAGHACHPPRLVHLPPTLLGGADTGGV